MKALRLLLTLVASAAISQGFAWAQPAPGQVFPTTSFDETAVAGQMKPGGPATLRGKVVRTRGRWIFKQEAQHAAQGTVIVIWPYTRYFEEFLALRKKHKDRRKRVAFSPEAYSYRILARVTGDRGEFQVEGLNPGKYYVEHVLNFTDSHLKDVPVGTETIHGSRGILAQNTIYEQQRFYFATSQLSSAVITIKPGDTLVEVEID